MQAEMPPGHRTWETGMRPSRVHPALALLEGKATSHAEDGGQRHESRRSFCTKKDPGARETGIVALLMCGQAAYVHTSDGVLLQGSQCVRDLGDPSLRFLAVGGLFLCIITDPDWSSGISMNLS